MHGLLIGDPQLADFRSAWASLQREDAFVALPSVSRALERIGEFVSIETVLIAPAFPDQFTVDEVFELQRHLPLARFFVVVGSWCEGEERSGRPWPGVRRIYAHQLINRIDCLKARPHDPNWQDEPWPATLSADEQWLYRVERAPVTGDSLVAVCSDSSEGREVLAQAARTLGYRVLVTAPGRFVQSSDVAAVLLDVPGTGSPEPDDLKHLRRAFPAAALVALVSFPRPHEIQHWQDAGCRAVLGKPYLLHDLASCLRQATRQNQAVTR